jgi:ribonuclease P protein subunit POP4
MDSRISKKIDPELIPESLKSLETKRDPRFESFSEQFVKAELLQEPQNPENVFSQKVDRKVLNLDAKQVEITAPKPEYKSKNKALNRNKRKSMGLEDITKEQQKYNLFEPLHELWKQYIEKLIILPFKGTDDQFTKISRADLHGAYLTVTQCKCTPNIGISGIVVKDTKNLFEIITRDDKLKMIPKAHTNFRLSVGGINLILFGNQLRSRPAERISKKLKNHHSIIL